MHARSCVIFIVIDVCAVWRQTLRDGEFLNGAIACFRVFFTIRSGEEQRSITVTGVVVFAVLELEVTFVKIFLRPMDIGVYARLASFVIANVNLNWNFFFVHSVNLPALIASKASAASRIHGDIRLPSANG